MEEMDNSLNDFVVPDKQKNGPSWLDFSWVDQCHFLVEYLSDGKMPHKDKWDMSKYNKYDFKQRAKKFYLDMNGELYTKVSHKDSISKVTVSKYLWIYVVMYFEAPKRIRRKLWLCVYLTLNAFETFEVLQSTQMHSKTDVCSMAEMKALHLSFQEKKPRVNRNYSCWDMGIFVFSVIGWCSVPLSVKPVSK